MHTVPATLKNTAFAKEQRPCRADYSEVVCIQDARGYCEIPFRQGNAKARTRPRPATAEDDDGNVVPVAPPCPQQSSAA